MASSSRKHVLLLPFPAFGHYIPFVELAKKIHEFHDVTLAVSSFKEADIRQRDLLPPAHIRFLPVQDNLSINLDVDINPKKLIDNIVPLRPYYEALLTALTGEAAKTSNRAYANVPAIDALITDYSFLLPLDKWANLGIPLYSLCPFAATLLEQGLNFDENTPTVPDEYFFKGDHDFTKGMPESFKTFGVEMLKARKHIQKMMVNSFNGLEQEAMEKIGKHPEMANIPAHFIGPLIPHEDHMTPEAETMDHYVKDWLDKQPEKSCVYVSFGSIATASAEQLNELGEALVSLGRTFIWSLRPFQQEHLPEKFLRVDKNNFPANAPYLILPWAPQKTILSHPSTVVFVSHCGWNSSLEAVSYGIPVCAWPMFGDQHPNALLLQAKGMAEILHTQGMKGTEIVPAEKIKKDIETVAGWNGGEDSEKYVQAAAKYGKLAKEAVSSNGSSTKSFVQLMKAL